MWGVIWPGFQKRSHSKRRTTTTGRITIKASPYTSSTCEKKTQLSEQSLIPGCGFLATETQKNVKLLSKLVPALNSSGQLSKQAEQYQSWWLEKKELIFVLFCVIFLFMQTQHRRCRRLGALLTSLTVGVTILLPVQPRLLIGQTEREKKQKRRGHEGHSFHGCWLKSTAGRSLTQNRLWRSS